MLTEECCRCPPEAYGSQTQQLNIEHRPPSYARTLARTHSASKRASKQANTNSTTRTHKHTQKHKRHMYTDSDEGRATQEQGPPCHSERGNYPIQNLKHLQPCSSKVARLSSPPPRQSVARSTHPGRPDRTALPPETKTEVSLRNAGARQDPVVKIPDIIGTGCTISQWWDGTRAR